MNATKLIVHAINVHQGGGRALLAPLLKTLANSAKFILLDSRMPLPKGVLESVQIKQVKPLLMERFNAERWLSNNVCSGDIVLCFGNLPPLFKLRGRVVVFVQNRYLIDKVELNGFPLHVRLRLVVERLWLNRKMCNVDEFVVQTPSMKKLLEKKSKGRVPVHVLPFSSEPMGYFRKVSQPISTGVKDFDFVYVASGEAHKNHKVLLEAWCLLAVERLFPSLCLTLDEHRFGKLCKEIDTMSQQHGLKVTNVGELSHKDTLALYENAGALIYPSTFESFGLPLIEARQAGLPVVASELDYVRDVIDPEQSFDPESATSIARAVKRFMGKEEQELPLLDANGFIGQIVKFGGDLP